MKKLKYITGFLAYIILISLVFNKLDMVDFVVFHIATYILYDLTLDIENYIFEKNKNR